MSLVPYVVEQTARGERSYDIFSRLLNDRIISHSQNQVPKWMSHASNAVAKAAECVKVKAGLKSLAAVWCIRMYLKCAALILKNIRALHSVSALSVSPCSNTKLMTCIISMKMTSDF